MSDYRYADLVAETRAFAQRLHAAQTAYEASFGESRDHYTDYDRDELYDAVRAVTVDLGKHLAELVFDAEDKFVSKSARRESITYRLTYAAQQISMEFS